MDADLDLLTGDRAPQLDRLYRLAVYCSENLVLSETGLIELASEASASEPRSLLQRRLDFQRRASRAIDLLLPLFTIYATARILGVDVPTVSYAVARLCREQANPDTLCPRLIRLRMLSVTREIIRQRSLQQFRAAKATVLAQIASWPGSPAAFVSGKSYLLPLAHALLRTLAGFNDSFDSFRVRMAAHADLGVDPGLVQQIRAVAFK